MCCFKSQISGKRHPSNGHEPQWFFLGEVNERLQCAISWAWSESEWKGKVSLQSGSQTESAPFPRIRIKTSTYFSTARGFACKHKKGHNIMKEWMESQVQYLIKEVSVLFGHPVYPFLIVFRSLDLSFSAPWLPLISSTPWLDFGAGLLKLMRIETTTKATLYYYQTGWRE